MVLIQITLSSLTCREPTSMQIKDLRKMTFMGLSHFIV